MASNRPCKQSNEYTSKQETQEHNNLQHNIAVVPYFFKDESREKLISYSPLWLLLGSHDKCVATLAQVFLRSPQPAGKIGRSPMGRRRYCWVKKDQQKLQQDRIEALEEELRQQQRHIDALKEELRQQQQRQQRHIDALKEELRQQQQRLDAWPWKKAVKITVIEWNRSPYSLLSALKMEPTLANCRAALRSAGHPVEIGDRAPLLVLPHHADKVREHVQSYGIRFKDGTHKCQHELRPRHLLCNSELVRVVRSAIGGIPSKEKVTIKRQIEFEVGPRLLVYPRAESATGSNRT